MPAVTPAEQHNPERHESSNAIRPARLRAPPQASAPCRGGPACPPHSGLSPCSLEQAAVACHAGGHAGRATQSRLLAKTFAATQRVAGQTTAATPPAARLRTPPCRRRGARRQACHTGNSRGASRQACHAGGHAGRATQSRAVRERAIQPARLRTPPQPAAPKWSKPPGLPCRRSRRQSTHNPELRGIPRASGPHASALHLQPAPPSARRLAPASGASRQACHAGGHAGRATQSRTPREFQRHPARTTVRSTSSVRAL
jgi:hypothetical protein